MHMIKMKKIRIAGKNKRGDVPITLLVIGAIVVYIYALVTFAISMSRANGVIIESAVIEQMNNKIDNYYFYTNLNQYSRDEIMNMLGAKTDDSGRKYLYSEELSGDLLSSGKKILYVEYYPPS